MRSFLSPALACCAILMLSACASKGPVPAQFDFGPLPQDAAAARPAIPTLPAIVVADVSGPAALDSERMHYRLLYADARQARPYAYHHWNGTPLQLLGQRLRGRLSQAGVKVLSLTDAAAGLPLLRVEAEEFGQEFDSASSSHGRISLRVSLFRGHRLVDQQSFSRSSPAPSADAAGGAQALADASDALSADILAWLASLPRAKE